MVSKMDRVALLDILTKNRDDHHRVFLEALEGYRKAAIRELERALDDAKSGREIFRQTKLIQPVDQTKDYDRAIGMLQHTTESVIELQEDEYTQLVLDQWRWGRQVSEGNRNYVRSDAATAYLSKLDGGKM